MIITKYNTEKPNKQILPTQHVFFNNKTQEWLTWSWWELWTIYDNGTTTLLNRTSEKIHTTLPLDNHGVLLLASDKKMTGFNPGYYTSDELFNNGTINTIGANTEQRKIYFLGQVGQTQGLFELEY